jgi:hypothetical protein
LRIIFNGKILKWELKINKIYCHGKLPKFASPCGLGQRVKDNQLAPNPSKLDIFVVTICCKFFEGASSIDSHFHCVPWEDNILITTNC